MPRAIVLVEWGSCGSSCDSTTSSASNWESADSEIESGAAFDSMKMYWLLIDCWPLCWLNFRHIRLSLGIHYNWVSAADRWALEDSQASRFPTSGLPSTWQTLSFACYSIDQHAMPFVDEPRKRHSVSDVVDGSRAPWDWRTLRLVQNSRFATTPGWWA